MDDEKKSEILAALRVLIDEAKARTDGAARAAGPGKCLEIALLTDGVPEKWREHHAAPCAYSGPGLTSKNGRFVGGTPSKINFEPIGEVIAEIEEGDFRVAAIRSSLEWPGKETMANPIRWSLQFMAA